MKDSTTYIIIVVLVIIFLYKLGSEPQPVMVAQTGADQPIVSSSDDWRSAFAVDLLHRLGNDNPDQNTINFVVAWTIAEDNSDGAFNRNNPLNTTQTGFGENTTINSYGVKGYPDYESGMSAVIATLTNGKYPNILYGLQTNSPVADDEELGTWGTGSGGINRNWKETLYDESTPISISDGDCGWNIYVAIEANYGSLKDVVVRPGQSWSFNQSMGDPSLISYRYCAGVPGGNWCNLASRYAQVYRSLGASLHFQNHGIDLGSGIENAVTIWNDHGEPGGQDLIIDNDDSSSIHLMVKYRGDGYISIIGWREQ